MWLENIALYSCFSAAPKMLGASSFCTRYCTVKEDDSMPSGACNQFRQQAEEDKGSFQSVVWGISCSSAK